ncbi:MAG: hypothetical protein JWO09_3225 [Bacteroidetes bacterium]|nr:hypothetical protein [Bacteroidota bacterium]
MNTKKTLAITLLSCALLKGNLIQATAIYPVNKFSDNIVLVTGLTSGDITKYLEDEGLVVETTPVQSGNDWTCNTSKGSLHYFTTVYTDGTNIIVHEDMRL